MVNTFLSRNQTAKIEVYNPAVDPKIQKQTSRDMLHACTCVLANMLPRCTATERNGLVVKPCIQPKQHVLIWNAPTSPLLATIAEHGRIAGLIS